MAQVLISFIEAYKWLIIIRVLLSWIEPNPENPLIRGLAQLTDPVLDRARRLIPPFGFIDFSPILVFILLAMLQRVIIVFF